MTPATMASPTARVVVIGGGFAGAMVALHLMRDHPGLPISIEVIEPRRLLGAGLAYSSADPQHRINVAASRMSPFVEDDLHFDTWLRAEGIGARDPDALLADGRQYPQRAVVGRYVDALVSEAAGAFRPGGFIHTRQRGVAARQHSGGYAVRLEDGATRLADVLVLAVGHPPPILPPVLQALASDARLVADPWDQMALDAVPRDADVLIVGTGLTACDVVASLRSRGHSGRLTAVSRRGLLPRARTALPVEPFGDFSTDPARSAVGLLRRVRVAIAANAAQGGPWENVIDALRRQGREVWAALPPPERLRFLRHLRAFWDVHRFQAAPQVADIVSRSIASGALEVIAASVRHIEAAGPALVMRLHPRGKPAGAIVERRVGAVVACLGPGHGSVVDTNPVLRSLAETGALRADPYGLGIDVDARSRCIGANERVSDTLLVAGPLARGTEGELMGLPQVSTQPRAVAQFVAELVQRRQTLTCSARGTSASGGS